MSKYVKKYRILPFGAREDLEDNEWVYSNLSFDKNCDPHAPLGAIVFGCPLVQPYAFCFLDSTKNGKSFVYHTLVKFDALPEEIAYEKDEILASDKLTQEINTMNGKAVMVANLRQMLLKKQVNGDISFEGTKCIIECDKWLKKYDKADFDCDELRIIPLHMNLRTDEYNGVTAFTPIDDPHHLSRDKARDEKIFNTTHEWCVGAKKGTEIELDGLITMTVDMFPDATPTEHSKNTKTVKQILDEKNIKSYDLYTFVVRTFDPMTGTYDHEVFNIFWDGDVPEFDDSEENLDKIVNNTNVGFSTFVEIMRRNKFLPNCMSMKLEEADGNFLCDVNAAYRVYIEDTLVINYEDIEQANRGNVILPSYKYMKRPKYGVEFYRAIGGGATNVKQK